MPKEESTTLSLLRTENPNQARACLAIRWLTTSGHDCSLLTGSQLTLGRGADTDLRLDSGGVSRRHAALVRQGPIFSIRDLESRNGTFVNGRRVQHAALSEGDVLRLGDAIGVLARVVPGRIEPPFELGGALFGPDLGEQLIQIRLIAVSDLPIVITGETGVGKESVARAVHLLSGRRGPFHAVNCAAMPAGLAEAELFGYRKGAFSGADAASVGHLRAAQGGTLLLDELPELPLTVQAKLLRVIQEKEVTPLGETRAQPLDVRFLSACQPHLEQLVQSKRLRQDLAARLSGAMVEITPLRERRSDAGYLFGFFLQKLTGGRPPRVDAKLLERLLLYRWPNNVRELFMLTQRLLVTNGDEDLLKQAMLPEVFGRSESAEPDMPKVPPAPAEERNDHDLRQLLLALEACDGNMSRAAARAHISRQRAYRLMAARSAPEVDGEVPSERNINGAHGTRL